MKELQLKYGCNPNQKPSRIFMTEGELPIEVINGRPGYINFLDAFNCLFSEMNIGGIRVTRTKSKSSISIYKYEQKR